MEDERRVDDATTSISRLSSYFERSDLVIGFNPICADQIVRLNEKAEVLRVPEGAVFDTVDENGRSFVYVVAKGQIRDLNRARTVSQGHIVGYNRLLSLKDTDAYEDRLEASGGDVTLWRIECGDLLQILKPQGLAEVVRLFEAYSDVRGGPRAAPSMDTTDLLTSLMHQTSGLTVEDMKRQIAKQTKTNDSSSSSSKDGGLRRHVTETMRRSAREEFSKMMKPMTAAHVQLIHRLTRFNADGATVGFEEFLRLVRIVCGHGAHFQVAFRIFDHTRSGVVTLQEVREQLESAERKTRMGIPSDFRFDFDCDLVKQYFGDGTRKLNFAEFSQFFVHLQREIVRQQFNHYQSNGRISHRDFMHLAMSKIFSAGMPEYMRRRVFNLFLNHAKNRGEVSYPEFSAFNDFLRHLPAIETAILAHMVVTGKNNMTRDELTHSYIQSVRDHVKNFLSPIEIELTWDVFDVSKTGFISREDVELLMGVTADRALSERTHSGITPRWSKERRLMHASSSSGSGDETSSSSSSETTPSIFQSIFKFASNFVLGGIAGGIGVLAVYPIDLVKTRMQNQRTPSSVGAGKPQQMMYKNSVDCFVKVLRAEGFRGLYRGILPQLAGVSPEKAIKLATNDFLRGVFTKKNDGTIHPALEVVAGMGAGASQVIFTNPVEIVKIRLQTAALLEAQGGPNVVRRTGLGIVRELGFTGLYKGAGACFLRDIPFSAIYFPCYAFCKKMLAVEQPDGTHDLTYNRLLVAGALAGVPAAYLCTPADVIKTRLQAEAAAAGAGARSYTGIRDAFTTILKEEGFGAFFKGGVARVCRSSPQFGVTLMAYEMLHKFFAPEKAIRNPPTNAPLSDADRRVLQRHWETLDHNIGRLSRVDAF